VEPVQTSNTRAIRVEGKGLESRSAVQDWSVVKGTCRAHGAEPQRTLRRERRREGRAAGRGVEVETEQETSASITAMGQG
jgi:hypothetical protein